MDEKLGRMVTRVVLPRVVMHSRFHYGVMRNLPSSAQFWHNNYCLNLVLDPCKIIIFIGFLHFVLSGLLVKN